MAAGDHCDIASIGSASSASSRSCEGFTRRCPNSDGTVKDGVQITDGLAEGDTVVIGKVQAQTEDEPRRRGLF